VINVPLGSQRRIGKQWEIQNRAKAAKHPVQRNGWAVGFFRSKSVSFGTKASDQLQNSEKPEKSQKLAEHV